MGDAAQHALLSASGAARWGTCAASLRRSYGAPRRSSRYADDGTATHELTAWSLLNKACPSTYPAPVITVDGVDYDVDADRVRRVQRYLEVVREYAGDDGYVMAEQKVSYGRMLLGDDPVAFSAPDGNFQMDPAHLAWGTSDTIIVKGETLIVIDLKDGAGVKVDVHENEQFMLYALGALYEFGLLADFKDVVMVVVQPKLDHVDEYVCAVNDLLQFAAEMKPKALRALEALGAPDVDATEQGHLVYYQPSDKGCRFCDHKATCPALRATVVEETRDFFAAFAAGAGAPAKAEVAEFTSAIGEDRLSQAMSNVDLMEAYCKAVRAEVERRLLAGQPVAGFKLVEGRRGNRNWVSEVDAEGLMKSFRLKREDMYDFSLKSPTSMEKALKDSNPKRWTKLAGLITRTDGKPSVAPVSDKREALVLTSVDDAFAALVEDVAA